MSLLVLACVTVVLAAVIFLALLNAKVIPPWGYIGWPGFDGINMATSRYVPPGTMLIFGTGFTPSFEPGPITFADEHDEHGRQRLRIDMEARLSMQINRPDAFVRLTGI